MYKPNQDVMGGQEFDWAMIHNLPELPPRDVVQEVNPWRTAMSQVLWGMALSGITVQLLYLHYILPTIGLVLMLLGFRAMQRENGWLRACYGMTVLLTGIFFAQLLMNCTMYRFGDTVSQLLGLLTTLLHLGIYFCFWLGLKRLRKKAGQPPEAGAAAVLLVWYLLVCGLSLLSLSSGFFALIMLLAYVLLLVSLNRLSKTIAEAGYAMQPAALRFTNRSLVLGLAALLLAGGIGGYLLGGRHAMDWQPVDEAEHTAVAADAAHLRELGFPEEVLADLTAEDIAACADAVCVYSDVSLQTFTERTADEKQLRFTSVAVQLEPEGDWLIIHHFLWLKEPSYHGTGCLLVWPASTLEQGWATSGGISGRLLCDRDGAVCAADYAYLGQQTYAPQDMFSTVNAEREDDIFAAFSPPKDGENFRGYVTYTTSQLQEGWYLSSWLNYTYLRTWLQYPVCSAMQWCLQRGMFNNDPLVTVQHSFMLQCSEDGWKVG